MIALTKRQRQVIALVAQGHTNGEIGRALGIGTHTVKNHVYEIHLRLGTSGTRAALATWWVEQQVEAARDEGYARGFRHGYVDGLAAGRTGDRRTAPALAIAK